MIIEKDQKRFLSVFPFLYNQLLYKDVGAIPHYLSACGWRCSIGYFPEKVSVVDPSKRDYLEHVEFISMGLRSNRISNAFRIIKFLVMRGSEFDVVNFYHDSMIHLMYAFVFKFLGNRSGKVYVKLDMSHLELLSLLERRNKKTAFFSRWVKYQLSRISVDIYSVETTECYQYLFKDNYFLGRIHYIPNGIACTNNTDIDQILSSKEKIILTVGNLGSFPKYNELLIDAITHLDISIIQGWRVYLVGRLVNSDFYEAGYKAEGTLAKYVDDAVSKNPHLKDTFVFTGEITDRNKLFDLYRKAKIFCLTSRYESFGLVIPESMYFGDYLIASDLPSVRDLTDNGRLGVLFQVGDVQQLSLYLAEAMSPKTDLSKVCKDAHAFTKANVDWRVIVKKIDQMLSC